MLAGPSALTLPVAAPATSSASSTPGASGASGSRGVAPPAAGNKASKGKSKSNVAGIAAGVGVTAAVLLAAAAILALILLRRRRARRADEAKGAAVPPGYVHGGTGGDGDHGAPPLARQPGAGSYHNAASTYAEPPESAAGTGSTMPTHGKLLFADVSSSADKGQTQPGKASTGSAHGSLPPPSIVDTQLAPQPAVAQRAAGSMPRGPPSQHQQQPAGALAGSLDADSWPVTSSSGGHRLTSTFGQTYTAVSNTTRAAAPEEADFKRALLEELRDIATADPPQLFAGKYVLLNERVAGGQALVNFARDSTGGYYQYAIKCAFFYSSGVNLCLCVCAAAARP
jgi:hypothetical protein